MGFIHQSIPGRIKFHYAEKNYYFTFDKGGAAFLYLSEPYNNRGGRFDSLILSDCINLNEITETLKNLGKLKNQ